MNFKILAVALLLLSGAATAQQPRKEVPVLHTVSNQAVVQSVYPAAVKVEKVNEYWFKILSAENAVLGFAMTSTDYCKDVKGYHNNTPVMIITDKDFVIKKVALLTNYESLGYVKRLEKNGFFNCWVGKTVKQGKSATLDGYTGASITATAVMKNVEFLLKNGGKKLPKKG